MNRFKSSLTRRLVAKTIILQFLVIVIVVALSIIFWHSPGEQYLIAQVHIGNLVDRALEIGSEGRPVIADTPALRRFHVARPEVRVAIVDNNDRVIRGSDPELVAALRGYDFPTFYDAVFIFPNTLDGALAGTTVAATSGNKFIGKEKLEGTLFVSGNELRLADLPAFILYMSKIIAIRLVPVLVVVVLVVPIVVRRSLRPLVSASREAARIDLRSRNMRLPETENIPTEFLPLVRGINTALDRLDEAFSRQQRFAAQAAHEMRTPLAVLAARIDGLSDTAEAEALRRNVQRMRLLVNRLLFVARLERGEIPLDEPVDMVALARDVVADYAPLAIAEGREVALIPEVARLPLRGNAHALESALINLIENAVRVEPAGGTVDVIVRHPAEVLVRDHGPGIPPADKTRIFEPFWRRRERHIGAGLGLTIVQEVARAHRGNIRVEDTPGGGATFSFRIHDPAGS